MLRCTPLPMTFWPPAHVPWPHNLPPKMALATQPASQNGRGIHGPHLSPYPSLPPTPLHLLTCSAVCCCRSSRMSPSCSFTPDCAPSIAPSSCSSTSSSSTLLTLPPPPAVPSAPVPADWERSDLYLFTPPPATSRKPHQPVKKCYRHPVEFF